MCHLPDPVEEGWSGEILGGPGAVRAAGIARFRRIVVGEKRDGIKIDENSASVAFGLKEI